MIKMSTRKGRKSAPETNEKRVNILNFFQPKDQSVNVSSKSIVGPLLLQTINAAVDFSEKSIKTKKHTGSTVSQKTLQTWKQSFPWLLIEETGGQTKLKCQYCIQFNLKNVWSEEGTPNVQKSTVERHNESKDNVSAHKLYLNRF